MNDKKTFSSELTETNLLELLAPYLDEHMEKNFYKNTSYKKAWNMRQNYFSA